MSSTTGYGSTTTDGVRSAFDQTDYSLLSLEEESQLFRGGIQLGKPTIHDILRAFRAGRSSGLREIRFQAQNMFSPRVVGPAEQNTTGDFTEPPVAELIPTSIADPQSLFSTPTQPAVQPNLLTENVDRRADPRHITVRGEIPSIL